VLEHWRSGAWRTIRRVPVRRGSFSSGLSPARIRSTALRARFAGDRYNTRAAGSDRVRVYDPDLSTWYGPGLYGNRLACGGRLGYSTLGVAHRTLRCGTRVSLLWRGRTITVRVIDRGPYSGAEWDLTEATARRIGFSGKGYVGTIIRRG